MQSVQARMARAALELTVDDLAKQVGIPGPTLSAFESGSGAEPDTLQALNLFYASHGIELIDGDAVRAQPRKASKAVPVEQLTTGNDGGQG